MKQKDTKLLSGMGKRCRQLSQHCGMVWYNLIVTYSASGLPFSFHLYVIYCNTLHGVHQCIGVGPPTDERPGC